MLLRADGRDYEVEAAIGVSPLVQFLVRAADGRLQATALAWDVRRREWFDLHRDDPREPGEWGHWLGRGMTWNFQCASCHVTDFRKGYSVDADRYESQWLELGVGCEACHGPRARHASEADGRAPRTRVPRPVPMGLGPQPPSAEVARCAPCHARRRQLADFTPAATDAGAMTAFLGAFDPTVLDDPAFFADGQVHEECYEWTSFVQSKMYDRGVACSHCHEPHSGALRARGNALCLTCHRRALDSQAHTFHRQGPGSECVGCHMPVTTYMMRHARRDHSFSTPRPRLTTTLSIPNACTRCHADKDAAWAVAHFERWYGRDTLRADRIAPVVAAARAGDATSVPALSALLHEQGTPEIWRASAAALLAPWAGAQSRGVLVAALRDRSALVRAHAARALGEGGGPAPEVAPLLRDPARLTRFAAAWSLLRTAGAATRAIQEARGPARYLADHPAGRHELAALAAGDADEAEHQYRAALRIDPAALPARISLAGLLVERGKLEDARAVIEQGRRVSPNEPSLEFERARLEAASGRLPDAIRALETVVAIDPSFPDGWTNLGLSYEEAGRKGDARAAFERALERDAADERAREALERVRR